MMLLGVRNLGKAQKERFVSSSCATICWGWDPRWSQAYVSSIFTLVYLIFFFFQDFFIAFLKISAPKTTEMAFIKILHQRAEVFVRTLGATNH